MSILTSCSIVAEQARCLFHKKIYSLWNRPKILFKKGLLTMVQDLSIETMRVIGTLTPRLRCKLNPVQLNVMELGATRFLATVSWKGTQPSKIT